MRHVSDEARAAEMGLETAANIDSGDQETTKGAKPVRAGKKTGPGSRSIEVPREALLGALSAAGFSKLEDTRGLELVYSRTHHKCSHMRVEVFTSIAGNDDAARGLGEDAIRIVGIYKSVDPNGRPFVSVVHKSKRVHRSGTLKGVIDRTLVRAREAYAACNERWKDEKLTCRACRAKLGGQS